MRVAEDDARDEGSRRQVLGLRLPKLISFSQPRLAFIFLYEL